MRLVLPTALAASIALSLGLSLSIREARADEAAPASGASEEQASRPPRPPPPPALEATSTPWERHIEVGGDVAFVTRPVSVDGDGKLTSIRYRPAIGYGVHARWDVFRYLRFTAYFLDSHHEVLLPPGALGQSGALELDSAKTFSFGARISPTIPWSPRARTWLNVGVGWGRVEIGRMNVREGDKEPFLVRARSDSFGEIPLGIGTSFDIIPRWLSIELEVTGAFTLGQEGEALHEAQAIDPEGRKRAIGGFPRLDATFVQTLGLSLIL